MGGLAFLCSISLTLSVIIIFLLACEKNQTAISIVISLLFCIANSIIGIVDDFTKLKRKENAGLTPLQKLFFQLLFAILFLMARKYFFGDTTRLNLSFFEIDLGPLYYPFAIILLLGIINCANLTDGVDGLASSVALTIGTAFLFLLGSNADVSLLSCALMGGALGFLIFNAHPAKIFMGDTGSLFLGSLSACLAFSSGNPLLIILIGGVYVIEGISVILQVAVYKVCKKRVFKMAPLHHHLEKCRISEGRICVIAVAATLILSALALFVLER